MGLEGGLPLVSRIRESRFKSSVPQSRSIGNDHDSLLGAMRMPKWITLDELRFRRVQRLRRRNSIRGPVKIGSNLSLGANVKIWAPNSLKIANDVHIGAGSTVEVDGSIGYGTLIANSVGIVGRRDHDFRAIGVHIRKAPWVGDQPERLSNPVCIGRDVWIGYGAIVLSGLTIGDSAVISAGAVVTTDVRANTVVAGCPAREVGTRFEDPILHWKRLDEIEEAE